MQVDIFLLIFTSLFSILHGVIISMFSAMYFDFHGEQKPIIVPVCLSLFIMMLICNGIYNKSEQYRQTMIETKAKYDNLQKELLEIQYAASSAGLGYFQDEYTVTARHFIIATSTSQIQAESTK
jgi:hypothetical protein